MRAAFHQAFMILIAGSVTHVVHMALVRAGEMLFHVDRLPWLLMLATLLAAAWPGLEVFARLRSLTSGFADQPKDRS